MVSLPGESLRLNSGRGLIGPALAALRPSGPGSSGCSRRCAQAVRQFFALACQRRRWELNDMARRLDE
jgi:hypothetical protein